MFSNFGRYFFYDIHAIYHSITGTESTESSRKLIKNTPACGVLSRARELLENHQQKISSFDQQIMPALDLYDFKREFCGTANFDFNDSMLCILFFNILITI